MSILIDRSTRLLVQGITGRQAHLNTRYMKAYGTQVVAGVTPGKGGQKLDDVIPIYGTVADAVREHPEINATVIYVPPRAVQSAAFEAIDAGIRLILITTERCPQQDVMRVIARARQCGVRVIGPNSIGILNPGADCVIGLIGARVEMARAYFTPGRIGVISRSGGQTSTVSFYLTRAGFGQSTAVGIGGDSFVGTGAAELLKLFQADPDTDAVVYFGEVGTRMEEEAAEALRAGLFTKPLVAYVAGRFVDEGVRYGHAGALISRGTGDVRDKLKILAESGAVVLDHLDETAEALRKALGQSGSNKDAKSLSTRRVQIQ
jgi:succinyl-CoA synthetase alpha subunit